jgi:hypothetical protein
LFAHFQYQAHAGRDGKAKPVSFFIELISRPQAQGFNRQSACIYTVAAIKIEEARVNRGDQEPLPVSVPPAGFDKKLSQISADWAK